ncbi:MAG: hypothetical protein ACRBM6_38085 [Geminicoccales bacterium]
MTNSNATRVHGANAAEDEPQKQTPNAYLLALQAEKKGLEMHLDLVTNERDDLRRRLDAEVEDRRRLITLLVDQRRRSWLQRIGLRH